MSLHKLSRDIYCNDGSTCPGVWLDDETGDLIVVGVESAEHARLAGDGERSVRISRALVVEAVGAHR